MIIDDYQAITESEEQDLKTLLSSCQFALSNAETFMESLARDLSLLDCVRTFFTLCFLGGKYFFGSKY